MNSEFSSQLHDIATFLGVRGITGYLVGGTVRDILLRRKTLDIDIAIGDDPFEVGRDLARARAGVFVALDAENHVARVVIREWQIDLAPLRGDIGSDLALRDFTINAMAVDLALLSQWLGTGQDEESLPELVIDPYRGLKDLREGVIRMVSPEGFTRDPTRLLRAFRFRAELGFSISLDTKGEIAALSHKVGEVPGEKLHDELIKIFALPASASVLLEMDEVGILGVIFPEIMPAKGVSQPVEHHWDVFHHSVMAVDSAGFVVHRGEWPYVGANVLELIPWTDEISAHFNSKVGAHSERYTLLKVAALLHDVAKPETKAMATSGRTRFLGHAERGAEMTLAILGRLRFSNKESELISRIVRYHMRPTQLSQSGLPTDHAIYRYFRDTLDAALDTVFFSLADHLASRGPDLRVDSFREHAELASYLVQKYYEPGGVARLRRLVNGHDLMREFGLSPGPIIGRLLEAIREAQAMGRVQSREDAIAYAKEMLDGLS